MAYYTEQSELGENVSTEDKPARRCERCDRETADYVTFINPDNTEEIICWTCQERDDKNYIRKTSYHRVRRELETGATTNKNEHGEVSPARADEKVKN